MAISIKNDAEVEKMRLAGKLAQQVLVMIEPFVKVGITTGELNDICHQYIVDELDCIPAPLNYGQPPFPKSVCTSVNNVVCHGIPSDKKLKKGDIINIDVTVIKNGFHGDTSKMFFVGKPSIKAQRISRVAYECLLIGIKEVKSGQPFSNIGKAIEKYANKNNCSVVRDYCGHGIGANFHEEPQVLHYFPKNEDKAGIMEEGMTFTIEPMINLGGFEVNLSQHDNWTVTTKDKSLSAQWEHTILVTKNGCEVLTKRDEENFD
ncbi:Methionine aminopeptidase [hydrothermal vent metagenome]|uniref:Methionine aminopeptidase n=1 Tax=hydrothermal vent metagenome TaxID=652676 RepID=A0A1W1CM19_9ZZZZ